MNRFKSASLLVVVAFLLAPSVTFAQQMAAPIPISPVPSTHVAPGTPQVGAVEMADVGHSQTPAQKAAAETRTLSIEAQRSDITDLSKFKHDTEYLPKCLYQRNYVDKRKVIPMMAGHPKPDYGVEHHM